MSVARRDGAGTHPGDSLHRAPERGALVGGTHRALKRTRAQRRADKRDFCSREPEIAPPSPLTHPSTELPLLFVFWPRCSLNAPVAKQGPRKSATAQHFAIRDVGTAPAQKTVRTVWWTTSIARKAVTGKTFSAGRTSVVDRRVTTLGSLRSESSQAWCQEAKTSQENHG